MGLLLESPLAQLEPRPLEGVGLQDLGAGLEHRGVQLFDDIGAVEDERLMAAAGEAVVILEAQVELLERRPHPAVIDEHAVAGGGEEIAHGTMVSNLDTSVARLPRGISIRSGHG